MIKLDPIQSQKWNIYYLNQFTHTHTKTQKDIYKDTC